MVEGRFTPRLMRDFARAMCSVCFISYSCQLLDTFLPFAEGSFNLVDCRFSYRFWCEYYVTTDQLLLITISHVHCVMFDSSGSILKTR